jgi:hypothetical protein
VNANPKLPFADGSFDAVVCASAIQYYTQPEAVLAGVCVCVCVCIWTRLSNTTHMYI